MKKISRIRPTPLRHTKRVDARAAATILIILLVALLLASTADPSLGWLFGTARTNVP